MSKKFWIISLFAGCTVVLASFSSPSPSQTVLKTVVIDAGHGMMSNGGWNGARGAYSFEDEIALSVSKKLVDEVSKKFPELKIIETRPTKYITELHKRADIANQNHGDLFISIHVNAMPPIQKRELTGYKTEVYYTGKGKSRKKRTRKIPRYRYYEVPNTRAKGTQTYIWGAHKSEDKEIAVRENAPMLSEDNYKDKYGDIDPNSPEFVALSLVKTKQFGKRSVMLASLVEQEFAKIGRLSGGAHQRQVGIWVLQATAMPSVLVETGFITNPDEERYLNSEEGQMDIAKAIAAALRNYTDWLQKRQTENVTAFSRPAASVNQTLKFLETLDHKERQMSR